MTAVHSAQKAADRSGCTVTCFLPKEFTVLDATAFWNVSPNATLRAGVFNISNQTYYWWSDVRNLASTSTVKPAYSQPGRNFSISLAVRL